MQTLDQKRTKKETIYRRLKELKIIGIRKARRRKGIPLDRGTRKETTRIEAFLTEWDRHRIGVRIFRETSHSNRSFDRRNQRKKFARATTMKVFVKQRK